MHFVNKRRLAQLYSQPIDVVLLRVKDPEAELSGDVERFLQFPAATTLVVASVRPCNRIGIGGCTEYP